MNYYQVSLLLLTNVDVLYIFIQPMEIQKRGLEFHLREKTFRSSYITMAHQCLNLKQFPLIYLICLFYDTG